MERTEEFATFGAEGIFASLNGAGGFLSYYGEIFDGKRFDRLYIIKGGPGTGKSHFMREVARSAERRGESVEYYRCSSDPASLDGIIIGGRVAIMDGTAPHSAEPTVVGARDEMIDLGVFWDGRALAEERDKIVALNEKKSAAYERGYRYLSACGELTRANESLFSTFVRREKMVASVDRIVSSFPAEDNFENLPALIESVGMKGRVRLGAYESAADRLYRVADWYSTAHLFLSEVACAARKRGVSFRISYDPMGYERPNGIFLTRSRVAFVAVSPSECPTDSAVRVNMKRFISEDLPDSVKREYKSNARLCDALVASACASFEEAGKYHFELEKIYSAHMDFAAKERFTASFCNLI